MGTSKKYWKGLEELNQEPSFLKRQENEFPQELPIEEFLNDEKLDSSNTSRRDFLKFLGFSVSAATLAACETPVIRSIPYLEKPEEIYAGIANYYSSTFYDGHDYANVLVKTREGRPIFVGQNPVAKIGGNVNARATASVLSLYDTQRLKQPLKDKKEVSWEKADQEIIKKLSGIAGSGGKIRLLSNTIISPSTLKAIEEFSDNYTGEGADFKHITYDSISYSGIRLANEECFGKAVIPFYRFDKAKVIVSVGADFFNNWVFGNKWLEQYLKGRKPENSWMSRHFQFEANLSLTGSNADVREPIKPSEEGLVLASILKQLGGSVSINTSAIDKQTKQAVKELKKNAGKSLVVSGSNNPALQVITNQINILLENYGDTIDLNNHLNVKQGSDAEVRELVSEMGKGQVDALIVYGVNPAYTLFNADEFSAGVKKVKLSISLSGHADETGSLCNYICPDNNYLESWNDLNPQVNKYSLCQPTISKLFDTRQGQESLLTWAGNSEVDFHNYIKGYWKEELFAKQTDYLLFDEFWNYKLHDGCVEFAEEEVLDVTFDGDVSKALAEVGKLSKKTGDFEVVIYQKEGIGDGAQIGNPWLQELPDPITKVTWDNYITMSPADIRDGGYNKTIGQENPATVAKVTINGKSVELPVCPSPGQKQGTIGIAVGYGRGANGEKVGRASFQFNGEGKPQRDENDKLVTVGKNAFQFTTYQNGAVQYHGVAQLEKMDKEYALACTQTQHTFMGRNSVVKETTFEEYKLHDAENTYNVPHTLPVHEHGETVQKPIGEIDLWDPHPVEKVGHRWGMSIDLNTCIGCSACVVACHSENNVPVVGKDEVRRGRDMHWLRIDRYFSSDEEASYEASKGGDKSASFSYKKMEIPSDQPKVVHMPMMCQHCNHAGCETVCPVAATTHSNEGLNQMTYNRCIGTRYCANNCPYKVRRFNWFNYTAYKKFKHVNPSQDELARMVLNPDVAVRTRGVMEKCSMCVQRIQAGKLTAKKEGRKVEDGEISTACSSACPTDAITFGDLNDKVSKVAQKSKDERAYRAIEEVGAQPNIYYLAKVRNESEA